MARFEPEILKNIDENFLTGKKNIFIYPRNLSRNVFESPIYERLGRWSNTWGFLVTKYPEKYNEDRFFSREEYVPIFLTHMKILFPIIYKAKEVGKDVYIFKMDSDPLLWTDIIKPAMEKKFENNDNVIFLWEK